MHRRTFIRWAGLGTLGFALNARGAAAAGGGPESKPDPGPFVIIDAHTHFYDPTRPQGVPFPDKWDKVLYRSVLPKDYISLPKPQPVAGTVVVEASHWVEDNQWLLDLAAREPFIVAVVGNLPPGSLAFRAHFERFAENRLFRGIRVNGNLVKDGMERPEFMADLRRMVSHNVGLDVNNVKLPDIARLAQKIPELRIVVNHAGNIRLDRPLDAEWIQDMKVAAKHQQVYCKVSGLVDVTGRGDGSAPRDVQFYRPAFDVLWESFGENRLMYGSNWPVSERFAACATVQRIATDYFQTKGQTALENCLGRNAWAVYGKASLTGDKARSWSSVLHPAATGGLR